MATRKPARPKPALPSPESLAPHLGAVAAAEIARLGGAFDPALRASAAGLRKLLVQRRYPVHDAVFAFDERFGGLVVPDVPGDPGFAWLFGAFACLSGGGHKDPRGGRGRDGDDALVPVVCSPNDCIWFLDGHGRAFADDTIAGAGLMPFARDGGVLAARLLVLQRVTALRQQHGSVPTPGLHGRTLAKKLGLPEIAQATDEISSAWGDEATIVVEYRSGPAAPSTVVSGAAR